MLVNMTGMYGLQQVIISSSS